jgi:hypothetical protein
MQEVYFYFLVTGSRRCERERSNPGFIVPLQRSTTEYSPLSPLIWAIKPGLPRRKKRSSQRRIPAKK